MMASQTIKKKIVELQKSKQTPQNSRPKIQRVAEYLRNSNNFEKHYTPKFVSIGPIHHDNTNLKSGEEYKLMWAAKYIENNGLILEDLHKKIADNIDELKCRFSDDVLTLSGCYLEGFGCLEEKLSWMLFVDGCSLLHILEKAKHDERGHMNIKVDQLVFLKMDVLLLENQLPYEVLKLLWKDDNESELIKSMRKFLSRCYWDTSDESRSEKEKDVVPNIKGEGEHSVSIPNEPQLETPTHLLDLRRKIILTTSNSKTKSNEANNKKWSHKNSEKDVKKNLGAYIKTFMNIQDLRAAGVRLKSSKTRRPRDIDFSEGWFTAKLTLPEIIVDDSSAATFLNLIAYEMCLDFENDYGICSFAAFMDSLIEYPEDVKVLRSNGILLNSLGSDEELVDFFKIISTDVVPNIETYYDVRCKIREYYFNKCKTWVALSFHTYFSIAAVIALALSFIETWFTVYPPNK